MFPSPDAAPIQRPVYLASLPPCHRAARVISAPAVRARGPTTVRVTAQTVLRAPPRPSGGASSVCIFFCIPPSIPPPHLPALPLLSQRAASLLAPASQRQERAPGGGEGNKTKQKKFLRERLITSQSAARQLKRRGANHIKTFR